MRRFLIYFVMALGLLIADLSSTPASAGWHGRGWHGHGWHGGWNRAGAGVQDGAGVRFHGVVQFGAAGGAMVVAGVTGNTRCKGVGFGRRPLLL